MLRLLTLLLVISPLCVWAQGGDAGEDTTKPVVFTVKQKEFKVMVEPDTNYLWVGETNPLTVRIGDGGVVDRVTIDNGRIFRLDSIHFQVVVKEGSNAVISIYRRLPGNKSTLVETRPYRLRRVPPPTLVVCGVRSDSVIDRQQLINQGQVEAYIEGMHDILPITVISFRMISYDGTRMDTLQCNGNRFTIPMRRQIQRLPAGTLLYFDEVQCLTKNGRTFKAKEAQLFLDETNKYRIGDRNLPEKPEE